MKYVKLNPLSYSHYPDNLHNAVYKVYREYQGYYQVSENDNDLIFAAHFLKATRAEYEEYLYGLASAGSKR